MPVWEEQAYTRKDEDGNLITLQEYERTHKPTGMGKIMTSADVKLYFICGTGFFMDAYDLFIINLVTPIWQYLYFGVIAGESDPSYPLLLRGAVNAGANIGNVIGQVLFGFLGDALGRKFVYGKELLIAMVGIILTISAPNSLATPTTHNFFWYIFVWRVIMGIGIGGDYPMSAAIVAERSTLHNRGRMLGFIFSNQGWGTFAASIVTLILLGCFKGPLTGPNPSYNDLNAVWRLQIGLILVPAILVLYFRLTMPEGRKYTQSTELSSLAASSMAGSETSLEEGDIQKVLPKGTDVGDLSEKERNMSIVEAHAHAPSGSSKWAVFFQYFSEWRHMKKLIGTAATWFLVDVAFYGLNLNQSVILKNIGFATGATEYTTLIKGSYGNLIIVVAGYLPGYFITIATIEILGRKWIQIQGFLITSIMFIIIASTYDTLSTGGQFACFVIAQLFFNFGPNATTFIVPAEAFPSRVRGLAHGVSAATGKLGAILAGLLFNYLASDDNPNGIGIANVLWIFVGCGLLGAIVTFFFVPETTGIDADEVDFRELQEKIAGKKTIDNETFMGSISKEAKSLMWWNYSKP